MGNSYLGKLLQHMLGMSCYLVKASIHECVATCPCAAVWGRFGEGETWSQEWDLGKELR